MRLTRIVVLAVVLAAFAGAAGADTLIVAKHHQDAIAMAQKPAQDTVQKTWIAKDKVKIEGGDQQVLVRMDQKKMYLLDAKGKTASTIDLPIDFAKLVPPEQAAMMQQMMSMMKMTAKLTPADEKKKIGAWNTRRYDMQLSNPQGMKVESVMWVTKEIKIDPAVYMDMIANTQAISPMFAEMAAEFKKLDGIPVLTETTTSVMGSTFKSSEEVQSVEEKAAPAGTYDLPADYKVEPFNMMKQMGAGRG